MALPFMVYVVALFLARWFIFQALLMPKPVPGIPYNLLVRYMPGGHMVPLGLHFLRTGEIFRWLNMQNLRHKSPLVQIFLPSFSTVRPTLVLSDLGEVDDIVRRRIGEIDRADLMHVWFGLIAPRGIIGLKTSDKAFKDQKRLWNVVLSPRFLADVATPCFVQATADLVKVWESKAALAGSERAFEAQADIKKATLDGMWQMCIGTKLGLLAASFERLHEPYPTKKESAYKVAFARPDMPRFFAVFGTLLTCLDWVMQGFSSRVYTWVFKYSGVLGRAMAEKDAILNECIAASRKRSMAQKRKACALDEVIQKDLRLGEGLKNVSVENGDAALRDELLELLMTGHGTTASSIAWTLKYLTDNPVIQHRLRNSLRKAFRHKSRSTLPTAAELTAIPLPYLDAVVSETLRLSNIGPVSFRQTMVPCHILGHAIPAGTPIILVTAGPSYSSPDMPTPSPIVRSRTSRIAHSYEELRQTASKLEDCDSPVYSLGEFAPERWLRNGKFDPKAVRMLPFSAGMRGCFSEKIALLELKIVIATLISKFHFPSISERLSGYQCQDGLNSRPQFCYVSPRTEEGCLPHAQMQ
jgi:hypothetical protein